MNVNAAMLNKPITIIWSNPDFEKNRQTVNVGTVKFDKFDNFYFSVEVCYVKCLYFWTIFVKSTSSNEYAFIDEGENHNFSNAVEIIMKRIKTELTKVFVYRSDYLQDKKSITNNNTTACTTASVCTIMPSWAEPGYQLPANCKKCWDPCPRCTPPPHLMSGHH